MWVWLMFDYLLQGENPFSRDYRKSMFRDGNAYSQWMDRMYEGDIQVSHVIVM